jgi:hypothetical protein
MRNKFLAIGLIGAILLTAVSVGYAFYGNPQIAIQNVETFNVQAPDIGEPVGEAMVGITTRARIQAAEIVSTGDLTVSGDAAVSGGLFYGEVGQSWIKTDMAQGTTTILSVANPFGETVFVDNFLAYIVNGTSTISVTCGTSTLPSLKAVPTDLLVHGLSVATSTSAATTTTVYVANRIGSGSRSGTSGLADPGTNSEDIILWRSNEYITCYASTVYANALTNPNSIFQGWASIHVLR